MKTLSLWAAIIVFLGDPTETSAVTLPFDEVDGCLQGPMAQFGQYLGDWKIEDSQRSRETGEWEPGQGARWIFSCLGNGTAVQDFWIPGTGNIGTNLRTYDPETETWDIAWAIRTMPSFAHITAKQNDEGNIVMRYKSPPQDPPRKITFYPADEDGWDWTMELSYDEEATWVEVYRIRATPYEE